MTETKCVFGVGLAPAPLVPERALIATEETFKRFTTGASANTAAVGTVIAKFGPANPVLWLSNNTKYLAYLEFGLTIPKAADTPPGWIGQAERQWPSIVADETRKLRAAVNAGARV